MGCVSSISSVSAVREPTPVIYNNELDLDSSRKQHTITIVEEFETDEEEADKNSSIRSEESREETETVRSMKQLDSSGHLKQDPILCSPAEEVPRTTITTVVTIEDVDSFNQPSSLEETIQSNIISWSSREQREGGHKEFNMKSINSRESRRKDSLPVSSPLSLRRTHSPKVIFVAAPQCATSSLSPPLSPSPPSPPPQKSHLAGFIPSTKCLPVKPSESNSPSLHSPPHDQLLQHLHSPKSPAPPLSLGTPQSAPSQIKAEGKVQQTSSPDKFSSSSIATPPMLLPSTQPVSPTPPSTHPNSPLAAPPESPCIQACSSPQLFHSHLFQFPDPTLPYAQPAPNHPVRPIMSLTQPLLSSPIPASSSSSTIPVRTPSQPPFTPTPAMAAPPSQLTLSPSEPHLSTREEVRSVSNQTLCESTQVSSEATEVQNELTMLLSQPNESKKKVIHLRSKPSQYSSEPFQSHNGQVNHSSSIPTQPLTHQQDHSPTRLAIEPTPTPIKTISKEHATAVVNSPTTETTIALSPSTIALSPTTEPALAKTNSISPESTLTQTSLFSTDSASHQSEPDPPLELDVLLSTKPTSPPSKPVPPLSEPVPPSTKSVPLLSEKILPILEPVPQSSEPVPPSPESVPPLSEAVLPKVESVLSSSETVPLPFTETVSPLSKPVPFVSEPLPPLAEPLKSPSEQIPLSSEPVLLLSESTERLTPLVGNLPSPHKSTTALCDSTSDSVSPYIQHPLSVQVDQNTTKLFPADHHLTLVQTSSPPSLQSRHNPVYQPPLYRVSSTAEPPSSQSIPIARVKSTPSSSQSSPSTQPHDCTTLPQNSHKTGQSPSPQCSLQSSNTTSHSLTNTPPRQVSRSRTSTTSAKMTRQNGTSYLNARGNVDDTKLISKSMTDIACGRCQNSRKIDNSKPSQGISRTGADGLKSSSAVTTRRRQVTASTGLHLHASCDLAQSSTSIDNLKIGASKATSSSKESLKAARLVYGLSPVSKRRENVKKRQPEGSFMDKSLHAASGKRSITKQSSLTKQIAMSKGQVKSNTEKSLSGNSTKSQRNVNNSTGQPESCT